MAILLTMDGDSKTTAEAHGLKRLGDFIKARGSQRDFAKEVGCSESHLSLVLSGAKGLSLKLAKRISEATDGEVPIGDLAH
jgi:DNA-binding transcriptional regulator YdaS (Cro superfamily)